MSQYEKKHYAPPDGLGTIEFIAAQRISWKAALCEWIDNAFDADANAVAIEVGANAVSISDDGRGCAQLEPFIRLGESRRHLTTRLGRFGIGAKDAAIIIGGPNSQLRVESVHKGTRRVLQINWHSYAKEWAYTPPTVSPAGPGQIGTKITVNPVTKRTPNKGDWAKLQDDLGYIYAPALKEGRQISVRLKKSDRRPRIITRWSPPRLDPHHTVDSVITVKGKRARVYVGLVAEGEPNHRNGITYFHGFRVIVPSSQKGCGNHNASRVCGFVELLDGWRLAKNKDAIVGDEGELFQAVEAACRPVLEAADRAGMTMRSAAFAQAVESRLQASLDRMAKARRRKGGGNKGSKRPTGKGGRHTRAQVEQPGSTFPSSAGAPSGTLKIVHSPLGKDRGVGEFKAPVVYLNTDDPAVAEAEQSQNILATTILAGALISIDQCFTGQLNLRGVDRGGGEIDTFTQSLSAVTGSDTSIDGRPALVAVK